MVEAERVMEAVLLITTHWCVHGRSGEGLMSIRAQRGTRDVIPAYGAVVAGLLGPLAWIPGVLVINEVIMRRVDKYGALTKNAPNGFAMAKAAVNHHIVRMLYDRQRIISLDDSY